MLTVANRTVRPTKHVTANTLTVIRVELMQKTTSRSGGRPTAA